MLSPKKTFPNNTPYSPPTSLLLRHDSALTALYNGKVKRALEALDEQLPTFAVIDDGLNEAEKLCLLIERGSFWGMGYIPSTLNVNTAVELKELLNPFADNDTIRNSIYSFAELNPEKKLLLSR